MPNILVQTQGFLFDVKPDSYTQRKSDIVFYLAGQLVCIISMHDSMVLKEKYRPDNLLVKCEKCYGLRNEYEDYCCTFYWLEISLESSENDAV